MGMLKSRHLKAYCVGFLVGIVLSIPIHIRRYQDEQSMEARRKAFIDENSLAKFLENEKEEINSSITADLDYQKHSANISCDFIRNNTTIPALVPHWRIPFLAARSSPDLPRVLSFEEHDRLLRIMHSLATLLDGENIELVIFYGSLLGSVRMHDIIPWDDDADMLVDAAKKEKFHERLNSEEAAELRISYYQYRGFVKIWQTGSSKSGSHKWGFPFIDVYYFDRNDNDTYVTVLWEEAYDIPKKDFYPLRRRPLGTRWFLAPNNARKALRDYYGEMYTSLCRTHTWSHRVEEAQYEKLRGCKKLLKYYPRVEARKCDKGEIESVYLDDVPSYSVLIPWIERREP